MGLEQEGADRVLGEPCILEQGSSRLHLAPILT